MIKDHAMNQEDITVDISEAAALIRKERRHEGEILRIMIDPETAAALAQHKDVRFNIGDFKAQGIDIVRVEIEVGDNPALHANPNG